MKKKGVIFSDNDGTLCFHEEEHGIRRIKRNLDGTVIVKDPATNKEYLSYDISTDLYKVFLAIETQKLGYKLQRFYDFVCVTGARASTVQSRKEIFNFADAIILENGGMIFDKDLQQDFDWFNHLEPERKHLKDISKYLRNEGWILDNKGRTSALRVRKKDNPHKTSIEFENLYRDFKLPETLKKTINLENIDIILRSAGKENAVSFWMQKKGYHVSQSIGIGDDINDLDFLRITGDKYVLLNSYPEVICEAEREGWYISKNVHFEGINEILNHILYISNPR